MPIKYNLTGQQILRLMLNGISKIVDYTCSLHTCTVKPVNSVKLLPNMPDGWAISSQKKSGKVSLWTTTKAIWPWQKF